MSTPQDPQVVLVTGAGSGIGRLTALALARAGHAVYASVPDPDGRSREQANELLGIARTEGLRLHVPDLDVLCEAACRAAVDRILGAEGQLDVVVNNAAMMMHGIAEAFRPEQVLEIVDLNAVSWLRVNRAALPAMRRRRRGLLVYMGSGITRLPDPFTGPYAAAKAAGDALAEVMALEVAPYGIESVIVMPGAYTSGTDHFCHAVGPADGEVAEQYADLAGLPGELAERLDTVNLPGRRHDVAEVAEAVRDVVAMEPGTRPRRLDIDPQGRREGEINALTETLQRRFFERMGIDGLLETARPRP
ncbi:SDR family NAD(P)-dependent oxidoreductase [Methylobacterium mesophilicum]